MSPSRIRVIDLETAGNGPSDVCEIGWQDVVQGEEGRWQVSEELGSVLVNPGRLISADTMAIHHVQDAEVTGAPFWKEVAPSILRPPHPIVIFTYIQHRKVEIRLAVCLRALRISISQHKKGAPRGVFFDST